MPYVLNLLYVLEVLNVLAVIDVLFMLDVLDVLYVLDVFDVLDALAVRYGLHLDILDIFMYLMSSRLMMRMKD